MPNKPKAGAVIFAKDVARMARFYEGMASLSVAVKEQDVVVLESEALELVIHGIPKRVAESITITDPPKVRDGRSIKLFLPVASLSEAREKATALGGELGPASKEWQARGFRACDGNDPEGNVVQFREDAS